MREYTNKLLEMVEEGLLDKDMVIMACMKYMSEDDVRGMMEANEMIDEEEEDEARRAALIHRLWHRGRQAPVNGGLKSWHEKHENQN